jgi:hypothetical protein
MVLPAHQLAVQIGPTDAVGGLAVDKLLQAAPELAPQALGAPRGPAARWVGAEGIAAFQRDESSDARSLTPVYLRQSSAETQWDRLHPNAG